MTGSLLQCFEVQGHFAKHYSNKRFIHCLGSDNGIGIVMIGSNTDAMKALPGILKENSSKGKMMKIVRQKMVEQEKKDFERMKIKAEKSKSKNI
jgi:hypothetical protein